METSSSLNPRSAVVLESQHLDSFDPKRPDSPKNAAIVASFAFSRVFAGCKVSHNNGTRRWVKQSRDRSSSRPPGWRWIKRATDEKFYLNCSGRRRAGDAGTGGRHEGQGTGSAGGAAKSVGRCVRRGAHLG